MPEAIRAAEIDKGEVADIHKSVSRADRGAQAPVNEYVFERELMPEGGSMQEPLIHSALRTPGTQVFDPAGAGCAQA